jgi:hypothetical protein
VVEIVGFKRRVIRFVPVISAATYAAGYQLGGVNALAYSVEDGPVTAVTSVTINDAAKQKSALDLLFFSAAPATGADNAAMNISAADMASKFLGAVVVPAASYRANSTAHGNDVTIGNINLLLSEAASKTLYCVIQCQGTPTYATVADLTVSIGLTQD